MRSLGRALLVVLPALLAACNDTPTSPTRPPPNPNASLTITCPPNQTATAPAGGQVAVSFPQATAAGGVAPVQVSCTRPSGSMFSGGTTIVQCSATDAEDQTASCSFTVTVTTTPPRLTKTRFLAFGDSLTEGEVTAATGFGEGGTNFRLAIDPNSAYPTKLAAALRARYTAQASTISVANAGRSGEWATNGARRIAQVLSVIDPEVLILLEGSNDLGALAERGVDSAASAIDSMAREGRGRGVSLIIATLPPPRPQGIRSLPDSLVRDLNNRIRAIAAGEGAVLVDLYGGLSGDVSRYIGSDGLHPTAAGYDRIAELMLIAIRSSFETRNP